MAAPQQAPIGAVIRLTLISDTHGTHPALPTGDVLIHCGDITHLGQFGELKEHVAWLKSLPFKHVVLVPGNHDMCCETLMNKGMEPALREKLFGKIHYLRDSGVTLEGVRFWIAVDSAIRRGVQPRRRRKGVTLETDTAGHRCPHHPWPTAGRI